MRVEQGIALDQRDQRFGKAAASRPPFHLGVFWPVHPHRGPGFYQTGRALDLDLGCCAIGSIAILIRWRTPRLRISTRPALPSSANGIAHQRLQRIALCAAPGPDIGFAARHADGEVEDVVDDVAGDARTVVDHLDHAVVEGDPDPGRDALLLGGVERVVAQLLHDDQRPQCRLVADLRRQLPLAREIEQPRGSEGFGREEAHYRSHSIRSVGTVSVASSP